MAEPFIFVVYVLLFISLFFEVFALLTFFEVEGAPMRKKRRDPRHWPSVTIIVPCYNEEKTLARTLDSLLALDYPKSKLSLLVVNDGSTDNTALVMARYAKEPRITLHHKENGGKWTALNYGIEHSVSELIGCLDADSTVAPYALKEIVRMFHQRKECMAVIPALRASDEGKTIIQWMQKAEYVMGVFLRVVWTALDGNVVTPGPFSFFKREVFAQIGLYREAHHTEDHEIAMRMQMHGMKIGMAKHAHVFTSTPPTFLKLYRQRTRWVYGFLRNFIDYRAMLFKTRYGAVGIFVLPLGLLSVFAGVYFMTFFIIRMSGELYKAAERISVAGFHMPTSFSIAWFYVTTDSILFLSGALVCISLTMVFFGKRILNMPLTFGKDVLAYVFLYGLLAPWWLGRALVGALLDVKPDWTRERKTTSD